MGRSFASVRMGARGTADRWQRATRALRRQDQPYAERLVEMAKRHASEGFYAFDDPLESAVFSALVEIVKELERRDVDP